MRAEGGFEAVHSVDQAQGGDLDQVIVGLSAADKPAREVFGHRQIAADQLCS